MRSLLTYLIVILVAAGMPLRAGLAAAPVPVDRAVPIALLLDLSNGQTLYARQADRRFVPASITKVMSAFTAFELVKAGELSLSRPVVYSREQERQWYGVGSTMFLRAGDTPTIGQLLLGITTVSGNDASVALAVEASGSLEAWLEAMNDNAKKLGMANTHFGSPNGYPDGGQTYTTANDLGVLGRAITQDHPGLYRRFFGHRTLTWGGFTQNNHDPVTGRVAGADGIKTGFTSEAGFTFLGSAQRDGRRLVIVIAGAPTAAIRDEVSQALLEWGFANFTQQRIVPAGTAIAQAQVQDGARGSVTLVAPADVMIALPQNIAPTELDLKITYRGPLTAPIAAGDPVAMLTVSHKGEAMLEAPLVARDTVEQANWFQRIGNALAGWFA